MSTVFLAGHGSWNVKDNGFCVVPKGVTVTFYTESMKNMFTTDMFAIIGGTFTGEVKQFYEPGSQVPNYTLYPDTQNEAQCRQIIKARNDKNFGLLMTVNGQVSDLKRLMSIMGPGTSIVWCACRYTELKDVGGKSVGVNGAQGSYGDRSSEGKLGPGEYYFNPGTANGKLDTSGVDLTSTIDYAMASRRKAMGYDD
jgi:hypothetical protein